MNEVFRAVQRAFVSLLYPQVWQRLVLPMALILALVTGIFIFFWSQLFSQIHGFIEGGGIIHFLSLPFDWFWEQAPVVIAKIMAGVFLLVIIFVSLYVVGLLLMSILLLPLLVPAIVAADYPELSSPTSRQKIVDEGSISQLGSIFHTLFSFIKYAFGFFLTLPLWMIPGLPFFLTACWNGYLASLVFPIDVLQGLATRQELERIQQNRFRHHFSLGILTSMMSMLPGIHLLAPVIMALSFVHFDLEELMRLRTSDRKSSL